MSIPIYVIGSSNTDMVVKTERLPKPGETVLGGTFLMNPGGKGANQAVAAARLGGQVSLVANLGNDLFGRQALEQFKQEKIDVTYITLDDVHPSGVALINVDSKGENCIAVAPGANGYLTPESIQTLFNAISTPCLVLVQFEIPIRTVEYIIEQCVARAIPVIVNPAPAAIVKEGALKQIFAITPNETEAELLTGIKITNDSAVKSAAQALLNKGVTHVIITLGKRGAYWRTHAADGFVSAPPVTAIDTTAGGDCFSGALAVALAEGNSLSEAVSFACRAASISVTRMGAQASMPTRSELT